VRLFRYALPVVSDLCFFISSAFLGPHITQLSSDNYEYVV